MRNNEAAARLQAGTYEMETLMDPGEVVALLVVGPTEDVYRVTVIEGLRVPEILTRLAESSGLPYTDFEDALLSGEVSTSLREMPATPTLTDWEGLLFPDTYEFAQSAEPVDILQRLSSTMEQRVDSIDWSAVEAVGMTPYQGLIIASLIESEVLLDEERPIVSSVISNRLAQDMKLEVDATVLYAMGTRDVAEFDREFDSPYNTYLVAGLPDTDLVPGTGLSRGGGRPRGHPLPVLRAFRPRGAPCFRDHPRGAQRQRGTGQGRGRIALIGSLPGTLPGHDRHPSRSPR